MYNNHNSQRYLKLVECNGGERTTLAYGPSWQDIKDKMEGPRKIIKKRMNNNASTTVIFATGMTICYGVLSLLLQYRPY